MKRTFELQVLPTVISLEGLQLMATSEKILDFGTLLIYSCSRNCKVTPAFSREFVFLQTAI